MAASAAALTVGRFTLPVYEIYKVGEDLHWVEGMNILEHFGFNLVVIPHWNNAEGGTHDTRFCYMGEARLRKLEFRLPDDVCILGLDEHTACLLDLEKDEAVIRGIGSVTLRRGGVERSFTKSNRFPLQMLREGALKTDMNLTIPEVSNQERVAEPMNSMKPPMRFRNLIEQFGRRSRTLRALSSYLKPGIRCGSSWSP